MGMSMRNNKPITAKKLEEAYAEILFVARDSGEFSHHDLMSDPGGLLADRMVEWGFMRKKFQHDAIISTYYLTFKGHWLAYNFMRMVKNESD